ncbi:4a-hydroxytetrahydrobiopterin dehydratase [Thiosocius teredinicola]|uniref:4a-hydroxytetrahydrobiopterin dehydratase n=1 Tax=Thiosocius teredinicola TaxID=1973002 RepID=UPI00099127F6
MATEWQERNRPNRLEKRYEFANYDALRDFLDAAADLSERENYYPDMGFGRDYVNITIHADDTDKSILPAQREFAGALDQLRGAAA